MSDILRLEDLHKDFGTNARTVSVLNGVNFSLKAGEFVAITGPSGSGKSTLLNMASLLDQPTSGAVWFDNQEVGGLDEDALCNIRKHSIGMVFQKYCLLPHRSVLENVMFRYRYLNDKRKLVQKKAREAIDLVGLSDVVDQPARLLSGGEMQRVSIARAIVKRPQLLVADEPTGNLDKDSAQTVMEYFAELHRAGLTILLVTHNETLLDYCSRHLVCSGGNLISP